MAGTAGLSRNVVKWLMTMNLSFPLKNIKRDFSNGFLLAEILSRYYPKDVEMHSFDTGIAGAKKRDNWALIEKFLKKRKGPVELTREEIEGIINCEDGAIVPVLDRLHRALTGAGPAPEPAARSVAAAPAGLQRHPSPSKVARDTGTSAFARANQLQGRAEKPPKPAHAPKDYYPVDPEALYQGPRGGPAPFFVGMPSVGASSQRGGMSRQLSQPQMGASYDNDDDDNEEAHGGAMSPPYPPAPQGYAGGDPYAQPPGTARSSAPAYSRQSSRPPTHVAPAAAGPPAAPMPEAAYRHPSPSASHRLPSADPTPSAPTTAPAPAFYGAPHASHASSRQPTPQQHAPPPYGEPSYSHPPQTHLAPPHPPHAPAPAPAPAAAPTPLLSWNIGGGGGGGGGGGSGYQPPPMPDLDYRHLMQPQYRRSQVQQQQQGYATEQAGGQGSYYRAGGGEGGGRGAPGTNRVLTDYQPYTMKEYKKKYDEKDNYWELGRLGPDINVEQLNEKKAAKDRIKEMDRQIRMQNVRKLEEAQSRPQREKPKPLTAREKALQFAKQVPKPTLKKPAAAETVPPGGAVLEPPPEEVELSPLEQLELQHRLDRERVQSIKQGLKSVRVD